MLVSTLTHGVLTATQGYMIAGFQSQVRATDLMKSQQKVPALAARATEQSRGENQAAPAIWSNSSQLWRLR